MPSRPSSSPRARSLAVVDDPARARIAAWVEILRLAGRMSRLVSTLLSRKQVTLPQFDVLATLRFGDDITQNDLADRLVVTKGNVCQVLDRLQKLKWVERRPDPADSRANRVLLSPLGRR